MKNYVHSYLKENQAAILRGDSEGFHTDSVDTIPVMRLDAVPGRSFNVMIDSLYGWLGQYVPSDNPDISASPIYMGLGRIADSVFNFNEKQFAKGTKSVLGVEFPVGEDWWREARDTWAKQNYELIKGEMNRYIGQVNALTEKAVTSGLSARELSSQIQALDSKITKGRANFIARDQIGKLNGHITQKRMQSVGLTMYEFETSGDERVRPSHEVMDGKLCRWDDSAVLSRDGGKTWTDRPSNAVQLHPGMDYQCRCTALTYWQELVGEADAQIDLLSENENNIPDHAPEGLRVLNTPKAESQNPNIQQSQQSEAEQRIARNIKASEAYILEANRRGEFPPDKFISDTTVLQSINKFTKGLIIPENVKLAESRIPINATQRADLRKELMQAGILGALGNSVFLTPEQSEHRRRPKDAVVNGVPFEFRHITGTAKRIEARFADAKKKGNDTNVLVHIERDIPISEVRRKIGLVLYRHPEYTGKIIVSTRGGNVYFWDSSSFR
jgi:SPP1 gp7 family putative phage head morphogenesis protein